MRRGPAIALTAGILAIGIVGTVAFLASTAIASGGKARLSGTYEWALDRPWFGGFSGIEVSGDGASAILLTDRAVRVDVRIDRRDGVIRALRAPRPAELRDPDGRKLRLVEQDPPPSLRDAEGAALLPDGQLCVSFEAVDRVQCYAGPDSAATALPDLPPTMTRALNRGVEALAADAQGRLYAIPEGLPATRAPIPVYRLDGGRWQQVMTIRDRFRFHPVGADIDGDDLYLLLRNFAGIGFASRLIRISIPDGTSEVLLSTGPGRHDNLEGLSVWRNARGELVATMVSDDNFNWFQRTEIVEYILPE